MDRPRLIRGLRIAWSVWWGILCVLLVVLWVRSYWWVDSFQYWAGSRVAALDSQNSRLYLSGSTTGGANMQPLLRAEKLSEVETDLLNRIRLSENRFGFGKYMNLMLINTTTLILPHWFPIVFSALLAALPWIRWSSKFSLRTLLIATTLIAVVLGLVAWSSKLAAPTEAL
jgi:hypothetical protein